MFPSHVNLDIVLRIVGHSSLSKCESNVKVSKQQRQSASARPGLAGCIRAAGKNPQGFVRTRNGMDLTRKSNKLTHANNLFLQRLRLCFTPHHPSSRSGWAEGTKAAGWCLPDLCAGRSVGRCLMLETA